MFVKICGITQWADAEAAVAYGAKAVGFVFWPQSPRYVDPYRARTIARRLPPFVTAVGVFVNQPGSDVNAIAALVGVGAIQLHGDETIEYARQIKRPIVKALPVDEATSEQEIEAWPGNVTLLLDVRDPTLRGGTGRTVDWAKAAAVAAARRSLLAGGLRPENVAEAVRRVRPFGIDVSSGVESRPGVKDHGRLKALFDAVAERDDR
jgi:phosphoribosylanthranilate isomerase